MTRGQKSVGSAFALTIAASGGTILLSLISGVVTARFLGTYGRGEVAAISQWSITLSWASALGFAHAMIFHQSKGTKEPPTVVSTALCSVPILGVLGVLIGQLFVPMGFAAQTAQTQDLARLFFWGIPFILGTETMWALLMAQQRFAFLSVVRLLQPFLYVVALLTLLALGSFTPTTVLASQVGSYAVTFMVAAAKVVRYTGWSLPSWSLSKSGLLYGLRLQGVTFGQLVTARLDLMMLPAFVNATHLGYYSIAVNVGSMLMSLFGSLSMVVFPVASSGEGTSAEIVARGLRLSLIGGSLCAIPLAVMAPWLVTFVYGSEFADSVQPLWLLLPGIVLWSGTSILGAGLQAGGLPGRASLAQVAGMIVTVIGLAVALPRFGIEGAAGVSSLAYAATFAFTLFMLLRWTPFSLRSAFQHSSVRGDFAYLTQRLSKRMANRAARERKNS